MNIKSVEEIKEITCDVAIISKFENENTVCDKINEFLPECFTGKKNELFLFHNHKEAKSTYTLVVGLGKKEEVCEDTVRTATFKAVKKCIEVKAKSIAIDFNLDKDFTLDTVVGVHCANYSFDKYKTKKSPRIEDVSIKGVTNLEKALQIVEGMTLTRDIANEPAMFATPTKLAEIATSIQGLETKIYEKEEIEKMNMGAYLAVAQGSDQAPKFIHMKYIPQNPKKRIAIIGKGLCFDSGGLDIKPASSMLTMKDDMSGAACTLGLMQTIAKLRPDVEVHGIIAACENMPSGNAYKPGDIVRAKNGKTIEVDNTDAEGRLTLADALCYACELEVDEVIDIATLTGACLVALGTAASGIMGNNDELTKDIIEAGKKAGEKFWELPMWQEYRDNMNSDVADMKNTGTRYGGASAAGMFLKEFVTDKVKWAHLDIAGTAFLESPTSIYCKGATGVGVRTLVNYILK